MILVPPSWQWDGKQWVFHSAGWAKSGTNLVVYSPTPAPGGPDVAENSEKPPADSSEPKQQQEAQVTVYVWTGVYVAPLIVYPRWHPHYHYHWYHRHPHYRASPAYRHRRYNYAKTHHHYHHHYNNSSRPPSSSPGNRPSQQPGNRPSQQPSTKPSQPSAKPSQPSAKPSQHLGQAVPALGQAELSSLRQSQLSSLRRGRRTSRQPSASNRRATAVAPASLEAAADDAKRAGLNGAGRERQRRAPTTSLSVEEVALAGERVLEARHRCGRRSA